MSRKPRLREPFDKEHGKRAQALLKSPSEQLYHIHWLLPSQLSWKLSLSLTCRILGLLFNTLRLDKMYPVLNRDNLTIPIQKQLSQKQKTFSQFFVAFLKSTLNFKYFQKNMILIDFVFPKLGTSKTWPGKCLKSPVSEDLSTSNIVNVPNHCWNRHQSIFIIFIDHCQVKWDEKTLFFQYSKSWDCFLRHWLPMKSLHFLLDTI